MKLRTRIAAAAGAVVAAAVALVGAVEYPAVDAGLRGQMDSDLARSVPKAASLYGQVWPKLMAQGGLDGGSELVPFGGYEVQFLSPSQVRPASGFAPVTAQDMAAAAGSGPAYYRYLTVKQVSYRVYTAPLPGYPGVAVRIAQPASDPEPTLNRLVWLLVVLTPAAGLAALLAGRLLAGRVLRPVGELTAAVEHITSTGDLTTPVAARGRDEVGRLARAFATMTAALDGSVGAQRRLVADASHELRTPLTSLTTNLELLAEKPSDPAAPALIGDALDQARELRVLINDLVDLARFGEAARRTAEVRLDLVAAAVAERRGVSVRAAEAVTVCGDEDALERAVANLVDNAVKFSGPGPGLEPARAAVRTDVVVEVRREGPIAVLEVRDHGPGIPAADLPFVFDRFHRSPAARSLPGSGLGLAIVKQIAEAHGGSVSVVSQPAGALVRIAFPATICPCSEP